MLCFQRRFFKENSVIRLKSNILAPPQIFGLATPLPPQKSSWHNDWAPLFLQTGPVKSLCCTSVFECKPNRKVLISWMFVQKTTRAHREATITSTQPEKRYFPRKYRHSRPGPRTLTLNSAGLKSMCRFHPILWLTRYPPLFWYYFPSNVFFSGKV